MPAAANYSKVADYFSLPTLFDLRKLRDSAVFPTAGEIKLKNIRDILKKSLIGNKAIINSLFWQSYLKYI